MVGIYKYSKFLISFNQNPDFVLGNKQPTIRNGLKRFCSPILFYPRASSSSTASPALAFLLDTNMPTGCLKELTEEQLKKNEPYAGTTFRNGLLTAVDALPASQTKFAASRHWGSKTNKGCVAPARIRVSLAWYAFRVAARLADEQWKALLSGDVEMDDDATMSNPEPTMDDSPVATPEGTFLFQFSFFLFFVPPPRAGRGRPREKMPLA